MSVLRYDAGPSLPDVSIPEARAFARRSFALADSSEQKRLTGRASLHQNLDALRHDLDHCRAMEGMDRFQRQALSLGR